MLIKKTFLTLMAKERASDTTYKEASELTGSEKVESFLALYNELGVKSEAEKRMEEYYQNALKDLDQIDAPSERKKPIFDLFNFLSTRNF